MVNGNAGKGGKYRPVNRNRYERNYQRATGRCAKCVRDEGDRCGMPEGVVCCFVAKEKD